MSCGKQIQIPEEMDDKWASGGHVGITASTGQLSDNHDVIRLATYVNSDAAERGEEARGRRQPMEVEPVRDRFCVVGRLTICDFTLSGVCHGGEGTLLSPEKISACMDEEAVYRLSAECFGGRDARR